MMTHCLLFMSPYTILFMDCLTTPPSSMRMYAMILNSHTTGRREFTPVQRPARMYFMSLSVPTPPTLVTWKRSLWGMRTLWWGPQQGTQLKVSSRLAPRVSFPVQLGTRCMCGQTTQTRVISLCGARTWAHFLASSYIVNRYDVRHEYDVVRQNPILHTWLCRSEKYKSKCGITKLLNCSCLNWELRFFYNVVSPVLNSYIVGSCLGAWGLSFRLIIKCYLSYLYFLSVCAQRIQSDNLTTVLSQFDMITTYPSAITYSTGNCSICDFTQQFILMVD